MRNWIETPALARPDCDMPRGYKRRNRRNYRRLFTIVSVPIFVLILSLAWIWKSNQVKENYAAMKKLETQKTNLIAENLRLRAGLMDLKSLSEINKVVTTLFGLTQNVSARLFLSDPVDPEKKYDKINFAVEKDIPDWLETAVTGSDHVKAETPKESGE